MEHARWAGRGGSWTATANATKGDPAGDVIAKRNIHLEVGRLTD